jgi:hypothetical protein
MIYRAAQNKARQPISPRVKKNHTFAKRTHSQDLQLMACVCCFSLVHQTSAPQPDSTVLAPTNTNSRFLISFGAYGRTAFPCICTQAIMSFRQVQEPFLIHTKTLTHVDHDATHLAHSSSRRRSCPIRWAKPDIGTAGGLSRRG